MKLIRYNKSLSVFQNKEKGRNKLENQVNEMLLTSFHEKGTNSLIMEGRKHVGMICLSGRYESLHIEIIYILKKYRGLGIGKLVVDHLKTLRNNNPYNPNSVEQKITCCPFTDESEDFFLKQGFEPEGGDINEYYYLTFKSK